MARDKKIVLQRIRFYNPKEGKNQYIIEYGDFLDSALIAGLKNKKTFEFNFPSKELTTVSINLFHI